VGAESQSVRAIRELLRERGLGPGGHLAIGYWRRGFYETRYRAEHDNDRDDDYYAAARLAAAEGAR
jgi:hypothetical protein